MARSTSQPEKASPVEGPANPGIPLPLITWRGFTIQMFLFLVLPLIALLLVIVIVSQSLHHNEMRALVGDRDLRAVRASAASISEAVDQRATALTGLSYRAGSGQANPAFLDEAAAAHGFDGGLAVFDPQGRLAARSANAAPEILDLARVRSAGLASVRQGGGTEAAGGARLAPPLRAAGGRWLMVGLAEPGGGYVLAGAFTPASLARDALAGVASDESSFMLVSPDGDVLFTLGDMQHSGPVSSQPGVADVLRGESGVNYAAPGSAVMTDHSGEHVIAFSPVQPFGWGLVLEEPWQQNAGPLLTVTQSAPLVLVPVLVLALLALWFGVRQVVQPLQALEVRAGRLAAGDFGAIRAPVGGINEIQNLQEELIDMAAALQSAQQALHGYIGALTAGLETERRSLARELHDDTLQALIALNQHVQLTLLRTTDPQQRQPLLDLQGRVHETIANLRRAIGGLRPIYLEDLGLVAALGMLAKNDLEGNTPAAGGQTPTVVFHVSGSERRLAPEAELAFYRIAQEALNNATHHAGASQVQVDLAFEDGSTRLAVCDNGRGFDLPADPGAFAHLGHYGLLGMRERADLLGADIKIETGKGKGTQVIVRLPAARP